MKKNYLLLITILITIVSFGQFTENFDYGGSTGDLVAVGGGNWIHHSGTSTLAYASTSLSMTNYFSSGVGGSAVIASNSEDAHILFASVTSGTLYMSFLTSISSAGGGTYFIHLYADSFAYRARVGAMTDGSGGILFGIGASSSTLTYGSTSFALGTTYLVVASYDIATGVANLHVLTAPVATEPGLPETTSTGTAGTTITGVSIRQGGGGPSGVIDGIRVSSTWDDVMNNSTLAISQQQAIDGFAIYPNPLRSGSLLNIQSISTASKAVSIFDVIGKRVFETTTTANQVNVSNLKAGMYFVKVAQEGKTATRKLVIE